MLITSYYRGGTDKLSGVTFDTDNKTFKTWSLKASEWTHTYRKNNSEYSVPNANFKTPGDLSFYHVHMYELQEKINELKNLGFPEDQNLSFSFTANTTMN